MYIFLMYTLLKWKPFWVSGSQVWDNPLQFAARQWSHSFQVTRSAFKEAPPLRCSWQLQMGASETRNLTTCAKKPLQLRPRRNVTTNTCAVFKRLKDDYRVDPFGQSLSTDQYKGLAQGFERCSNEKNSAHVAWSKRVAQDCSARCGADFAAGVKLFLLRGRWKTPQAVILSARHWSRTEVQSDIEVWKL